MHKCEDPSLPGFPTDMQPQITVALALAKGSSIVTESIFENRFKYVDELARMGANIKVESNTAIIEGVERFTGAQVSSPDLRAGQLWCSPDWRPTGSQLSMISIISSAAMSGLTRSSEAWEPRWKKYRMSVRSESFASV